jgi:molybdenum cofactor cytidylyltransferase
MLARLDQATAVTRTRAGEVRRRAPNYGVNIVHNPAYETGEMLSSLKAGLESLPDTVAAALIVLGDQPRVQPRVINQILMAYAEGCGPIIAPRYLGQRGHPILIDRRYWSEFLSLPDGAAPRDALKRHESEIYYIEVDTDSVLGDVDTPEDYAQERWRAGLD